MGQRVRAVAVVAVLLAVGALAGSAFSQWRERPAEPPAEVVRPAEERVVVPRGRVRVEVLNGGGRAGMAKRATDHLRDRGYDVVFYGNADTFDRDSTVVVDRVGRPDVAAAVAAALGRADARVRSEADSTRFVDVSVILGASWDPSVAAEAPGEPVRPVGRPAWWDLRRFLPERDSAPPMGAGHMADPANGGG